MGENIDCFSWEVKKYIGRSVVIIVLVVLLRSHTCASTFMYSTLYTSTLVQKKILSVQGMQPTRYVHIRSTTYMVQEPLKAPYVPSRMTISLNREWYAMVVWGDRQWS